MFKTAVIKHFYPVNNLIRSWKIYYWKILNGYCYNLNLFAWYIYLRQWFPINVEQGRFWRLMSDAVRDELGLCNSLNMSFGISSGVPDKKITKTEECSPEVFVFFECLWDPWWNTISSMFQLLSLNKYSRSLASFLQVFIEYQNACTWCRKMNINAQLKIRMWIAMTG